MNGDDYKPENLSLDDTIEIEFLDEWLHEAAIGFFSESIDRFID